MVELAGVDGVSGSRNMTRGRRCSNQNHSAAFRTGWVPLLRRYGWGRTSHAMDDDQHTSALADARHTRAARGGRKAQAATGRTVLQRSQTRAFGFGFSKVHAVQTQAPPMVGTGASGAGAASAAAA